VTRILKVVPTLMCGGTENQFMTLGRLLDRSRFNVGFACLRRWGPFVDELGQLGIPLSEYQVATFRSVHALAQQARLAVRSPAIAWTSCTPTTSTETSSPFRRRGWWRRWSLPRFATVPRT
jgi:hypothetical protein